MAGDASSAFFSMTQAEYAAGNFKQKATEGQLTARIRVGAGIDNVAGVKLPVFSKYDTGVAADNQSLGLVGGGKKIVTVREKFTVLLELLLRYVNILCEDIIQGAEIIDSRLFPSVLHNKACFASDKLCHAG
jgi:V-type H+-transporting ATPase subunit D